MAEETDGVREAFDDALRIALTVATQLGEKMARLREQAARQREASFLQTNRELEVRFEAERGAMRASLVPLQRSDWWGHASVEDIANARETAISWRDYDDVARDASDDIEREVEARYEINADRPGANPADVAEALRTAESERAAALARRQRDAERLTAAELLLLTAERQDRAPIPVDVEARSEESHYDSAKRREAFAISLVGTADQKTIDARILADGENARHPREAVSTASARRPAVRSGGDLSSQRRSKDRELGR